MRNLLIYEFILRGHLLGNWINLLNVSYTDCLSHDKWLQGRRCTVATDIFKLLKNKVSYFWSLYIPLGIRYHLLHLIRVVHFFEVCIRYPDYQ